MDNDSGGATHADMPVLACRASIQPLNGREVFQHASLGTTVTHDVRMRYRPEIKPQMELLFRDRRFRIVSCVNVREMNRELQLICEELRAGAQ